MVDAAQQSHWVVDEESSVKLGSFERHSNPAWSSRRARVGEPTGRCPLPGDLVAGAAVAGTYRAKELGSQASPESPSERVSTRLLRSPPPMFSICSTAGSAQLGISANQRLAAYV